MKILTTSHPNPQDPKEEARKALDAAMAPLHNSIHTVAEAYKDLYLSPIAQLEKIMKPRIEAENKRIAELAKLYDEQTSVAAFAAKWQEKQAAKITEAISGAGIDPARLGALEGPQIPYDPTHGIRVALTANMMENSSASKALTVMNAASAQAVSAVGIDVKSLMGNALGKASASAIAAGLNEQMLGFKSKGLAGAAAKANELTAKLPEEYMAQLDATYPDMSNVLGRVAEQFAPANAFNVVEQFLRLQEEMLIEIPVETPEDLDDLVEDPDEVERIRETLPIDGSEQAVRFWEWLGIDQIEFFQLSPKNQARAAAATVEYVFMCVLPMLEENPNAVKVLGVIIVLFFQYFLDMSDLGKETDGDQG